MARFSILVLLAACSLEDYNPEEIETDGDVEEVDADEEGGGNPETSQFEVIDDGGSSGGSNGGSTGGSSSGSSGSGGSDGGSGSSGSSDGSGDGSGSDDGSGGSSGGDTGDGGSSSGGSDDGSGSSGGDTVSDADPVVTIDATCASGVDLVIDGDISEIQITVTGVAMSIPHPAGIIADIGFGQDGCWDDLSLCEDIAYSGDGVSYGFTVGSGNGTPFVRTVDGDVYWFDLRYVDASGDADVIDDGNGGLIMAFGC